jgi:hypothetical protein
MHRDRLLAAKAQEEAERYAQNGNFTAAHNVLEQCAFTVTSNAVKDVLNDVSINYCNASNYASTRGISHSVKKSLGGKRMAYTGGASARMCRKVGGAQNLTAMNDVADSFADNKVKITTTTDSDSDVLNITSDSLDKIYIDEGCVDNFTITGSDASTKLKVSFEDKKERKTDTKKPNAKKTSVTIKKRTKRDW